MDHRARMTPEVMVAIDAVALHRPELRPVLTREMVSRVGFEPTT